MAPMDPEPRLPAHLEYLQLRNQRPRSVRERRLAVMRTNRLLAKPVADASQDDLRAWQRGHVMALSPAGQHNEITHTAQYIRWVHNEGYRPDDPTGVLIRPRNYHQNMPRPMSDEHVAQAFLMADQPMRAWIALAAFCGLRCCEIAELRREDVRDALSPPLLSVVGKGGKRRVIPMPSVVLKELEDAGLPRRGAVFSRMDGQPGPPSAMRVSERINDYLHGLGIEDTAHSLRHRFGTALYRATRDPMLVARVMGHESVDTTRGYILVDPFDAVAPIEGITRLA